MGTRSKGSGMQRYDVLASNSQITLLSKLLKLKHRNVHDYEYNVMCIGLTCNKTQESRSSHVLLIATVSSTVVVLFILTFAAGVACGYYFLRRRYKQSSSSNRPDVNTLPSAVEHQEQGLKLIENVAYGSAKPMNH
jgi:hypothetical protein